MAIYSNESFYSTTLAQSITAVQTTIPITTAPNITSGYLTIESNTSNKEIILYTGVTGTTLTGVTRGLATYGSDTSGGVGKTHSAGVEIANKDVHYYYAQYYDFLVGTSSTGANALRHGDGNTISATNRLWYVHTSSLSAFWGLSSSGKMVVSEDGATSYVISAGGSGVTAGNGISITAGAVAVDRLSSGGLQLSGTKLKVGYDGSNLKSTSAGELYFDKTVANSWTQLNDFTDISIDGTQISATATEINTLIGGTGKVSSVVNGGNATGMHIHGFGISAMMISGIGIWNISGIGFYPYLVKVRAVSNQSVSDVWGSWGVAKSSAGTGAYCLYNDGLDTVVSATFIKVNSQTAYVSAFTSNGIMISSDGGRYMALFEFYG